MRRTQIGCRFRVDVLVAETGARPAFRRFFFGAVRHREN